jgi:DNA (cytosine-5)-methyltransferase 1
MAEAVRRKIERIQRGGRPRVLDLFAGCGGLSLGFQSAGFEITAAVENEPDAARSHGINFHGGAGQHSRPRDICTPPEELTVELGLGPAAEAFECQKRTSAVAVA